MDVGAIHPRLKIATVQQKQRLRLAQHAFATNLALIKLSAVFAFHICKIDTVWLAGADEDWAHFWPGRKCVVGDATSDWPRALITLKC